MSYRPASRPRRMIALIAAAAVSLTAAQAAAQSATIGRTIAPEEVSLTTKDGVQLAITYYASSAGPQAVPVILLHDFNETRAVFEPLVKLLTSPPPELSEDLPRGSAIAPRAVVTVDLRGHGQSKTAFDADGLPYELDANTFRVADFQDMVLYDLEAVRAFLVARNDAGQLNLNKLCLVGAGMGANVALTFAARDWSIPPLVSRKQGQDVKALVLLSPRLNFRGLSAIEPLKYPPVQQDLSICISYGRGNPKVAKDCEAMVKIFSRYHVQPPPDEVAERKDFFDFSVATEQQGSDLLMMPEFGLNPQIAGFIEMRLGRIDFPHLVRKGKK